MNSIDLAYYVCVVPTENQNRLIRRRSLFESLKNAQFEGAILDKLVSPSEWIQSYQEAFDALTRHNLPAKRIMHSVIWMYHPQTDKYFPIGDWDSLGFRQYKNVLHFEPSGVVGLNLSFYKVMREFLNTKKEGLLWLEDDAVLDRNWTKNLMRLLSRAPSDWHVINLAEYPNYTNSIRDEHKLEALDFYLPYAPNRSHCILISRTGADKFMKFLELHGSILPLDWILFNVRSPEVRDRDPIYFNTYFINPDTVKICPWSSHYADPSLTTIF